MIDGRTLSRLNETDGLIVNGGVYCPAHFTKEDVSLPDSQVITGWDKCHETCDTCGNCLFCRDSECSEKNGKD